MDYVDIVMNKDPVGVSVRQFHDDVQDGVTSVPADEWTDTRAKVSEHYDLKNSTRTDCTNIITALTIALSDR